jgi:hypothetical protein
MLSSDPAHIGVYYDSFNDTYVTLMEYQLYMGNCAKCSDLISFGNVFDQY